MKLLNLGCGQHYHPDWHNLDFVSTGPGVVAHNLLEGIPFEDAAFDVVYHSHVMEHFNKKDGQKFINECYRVLKPGGIIRIAVPDLEQLAKEYLANLEKALQENSPLNAANYDWSVIELLDQMVRDSSGGEMAAYWSQDQIINEDYVAKRMGWEFTRFRNALSAVIPEADAKPSKKPSYSRRIRSKIFRTVFKNELRTLAEQKILLELGRFRKSGEIHAWMYDRYSLANLLEHTGFKKTIVQDAFTSQISNWSHFGLDAIDGSIRKPDSFFIEAQK